jgi:DNA repair exonuclease SbcCD ATPase subunit
VPFVFSQAEIENIGLLPASRLRLIDGFVVVGEKVSESGLVAKIRSSTTEIRAILAEVDDITDKVVGLAKLQKQLEEAKAQSATHTKLNKTMQAERQALAEVTPAVAAARVRFETISRSSDRLTEWLRSMESLVDHKPTIENWPDQAGTGDELVELRKKELAATRAIRGAIEELSSISNELQKKKTTASSQKAGFENRARDLRQKIEEKQKGASAIDKKINELTQQISVLTSLADLRKERVAARQRLETQRTKLIQQLLDLRQDRSDRRHQACAKLNKRLGPAVRLTLMRSAQHREYIGVLSSALKGSGLRYNDLAERIAETFSPQEIASACETRATDKISDALEITEERALRLCDALRGETGSTLFTTKVDDDLSIELLDGSDYKSVDFLSMGQRCTAILPIILAHSERVIILDQPEDHLDNAFVVETLVEAMVARSNSAQTIVATHNPNIPVLGDAGRVIHLDSDGSRCFVRMSGPLTAPKIVEAITTLMEGGEEAFRRRSEFYAENQ